MTAFIILLVLSGVGLLLLALELLWLTFFRKCASCGRRVPKNRLVCDRCLDRLTRLLTDTEWDM